jgi:putative transcriptional regulator
VNYYSARPENASNLDAVLATYAVGGLTAPMHAMVQAHLVLSARNRAFVAAMEDLAAAEMERGATVTPRDRERRLADIFAAPETVALKVDRSDEVVPAPLLDFLGGGLDSLSWRSVLPGLKEARIASASGVDASMLWIKAGRAMPAHTHPGTEATLVLKGAFSDQYGYYERGDMVVVDGDVDHRPVAGDAEDCICFAVSEGPVKLTGPVARLFSRLLGR